MSVLPKSLPLSRVSILASLALVSVVGVLALYSVGMDLRANAATTDAEQATRLASAYSDFNAQLLELERLGNEFIIFPSPALRAEFDTRVARLLAQVDFLSEISLEKDRAQLLAVRDEYLPLLSVVQEFFDALLAGDSYTGPIPDASVVADLQAMIAVPVEEQRAAALDTMTELRNWQQQRVWTATGVYGGGLAAVALLMVVLRTAIVRATRAELEARHFQQEALHDSLTGLGNHRSFQEVLHGTRAVKGSLALLDIDHFKEANDTRGHAEGDRVLRALSKLIEAHFPKAGFRIGGDEFAILSSERDISVPIDLLLRDFREGWLGVTCSAGLSSWDDEGADPDLHLAEADAALRWAKREGRERTVAYADVAGLVGGVRSARRSAALRTLLTTRRGLYPVFQPIWSLDGRLTAFEALSRFEPSVGFVGPEDAFDIAHQDGHGFELDLLSCEGIMEAAKALPERALLFVNLSPASLVDPRFSVSQLSTLLCQGVRDGSNVVIEITERSPVPMALLSQRIHEIREAGFRVALDDVGAGNSGLETLRAVPVDWVKIDRSIVKGATTSVSSRGLLKAIFAFAGEVGATIVAEGIEDEGELDVIRQVARGEISTNVRVVAQGYLLGRPASAVSAFGIPAALRRPAA